MTPSARRHPGSEPLGGLAKNDSTRFVDAAAAQELLAEVPTVPIVPDKPASKTTPLTLRLDSQPDNSLLTARREGVRAELLQGPEGEMLRQLENLPNRLEIKRPDLSVLVYLPANQLKELCAGVKDQVLARDLLILETTRITVDKVNTSALSRLPRGKKEAFNVALAWVKSKMP